MGTTRRVELNRDVESVNTASTAQLISYAPDGVQSTW